MPRVNDPSQHCPPDSDKRKALEKRAREATKPAVPEEKGRWPFPVNVNVNVNQPAGNAPAASADPKTDTPKWPPLPGKPQGRP